jgi:hypothetical protein
MIAAIIAGHVLAAIGVGPIFTLPLLANAPAALRAVLVLLRFGAGLTLLTGIWLWVDMSLGHPAWLILSVALYAAVIALIAVGLAPAEHASSVDPRLRRRVRLVGVASSLLTLCIAGLMVLRPGLS